MQVRASWQLYLLERRNERPGFATATAFPGHPAVPRGQWKQAFETYTVASGASELPSGRRKAVLLTCLGMEEQRIFSSLKPAALPSGSSTVDTHRPSSEVKPPWLNSSTRETWRSRENASPSYHCPQVTHLPMFAPADGMFLSCRIPSEVLAQALSPYGKVLHITRGLMGSRPTVTTGTRYVRIEMKPGSPVSNYLKVAGHRITCDYKCMQRVCRRCGSSGHFRMNCNAPFCARCGVYGHEGKGCSLPCRRCGDPHSTVACTLRRSYSEAASEFPPLAPKASHVGCSEDLPPLAPAATSKEAAQEEEPEAEPTTSPASPDAADTLRAEQPSPTSRPLLIPTEPQADIPAQHEASRISASTPSTTSSSSAPVIDEIPSPEDAASINEDSISTYSGTQSKSDDDNSDPNRDITDLFVPPSLTSSAAKRYLSSSDSEPPARDRSPPRTSARTRKPRASGGSPGRKK
ncbi:hypothetical protein HPB50_010385 [Hyalomma asiaticum]|uniref:Uncharacterized protein n=1 Tax=Hyalomma asiaticum TaxID=266040 RepID=A0ACB7S7S5_HYAAI|nr:hypothetical protein HPB50_010385 [Hyalomma asiaticum]